MLTDDVEIHGSSGPPVLLLPGGAEACDGFFPGIVDGLTEHPGCRVIVHDRPGTGTSRLEKIMAVTRRLASVPGVRGMMQAGLRRGMRQFELRPDCAANFREDRLPALPSVLVTADRKPASPIARAHLRIATALGAQAVSWPGAGHNLQLDHPETRSTPFGISLPGPAWRPEAGSGRRRI